MCAAVHVYHEVIMKSKCSLLLALCLFFNNSRWCWDTEAHIQNVTEYFISSGLTKLGYVHINIDEGWLKGRDNVTGECVTPPARVTNNTKLNCIS